MSESQESTVNTDIQAPEGMEKSNWIALALGAALLITGFIALALGSITFAPLCIVAAYVTMILALSI